MEEHHTMTLIPGTSYPEGLNVELQSEFDQLASEFGGLHRTITKHHDLKSKLDPESKKFMEEQLREILESITTMQDLDPNTDFSPCIERIKLAKNLLRNILTKRVSAESQIMRKHRILRETREATRGIDVPISDVLISTGRELATQFAGAGKHAGTSAAKKLFKKVRAELRRHGDPETAIEISISSLSDHFRGSYDRVILVTGGINKGVK
jgi:hypothetical protein